MNKPYVFEVNGAKVALYRIDSVEAIGLEAMFHAGSWHEKGPSWGLMHLLEHFVHQGTEKFPDVFTKDLFKEDHGIYQNAYTGGPQFGFDMNFPTVSFEKGLELFEQLAFKPTLPASRLAHEQSIVTQEYRDKWSNPNARYGRELVKNLYGKDHLYTRDGLGLMEYVNSVTREDLVAAHNEFLVTENMTLAIAGNINIKETEAAVTKMLSHAPRGTLKTYKASKQKPESDYLFHKEDVDRVSIDASFALPGRETLTKRERRVVGIANYILGSGSRSRIFRRLRHELGLVYSAGSNVSFKDTFSNMTLVASVSPEKALEAKKELLTVFETYLNSGATNEEFNRARNYINMRTLMSFDSPYSIADQMASDLFWEGEITTPEDYVEMTNTITLEEVNTAFTQLKGVAPVISVMARNPIE